MDNGDWIDLPDGNYGAVLGYETENTTALDELIREYNRLLSKLNF